MSGTKKTGDAKTDSRPLRLVVVGSVGLDTVETPGDKRTDVLGGSASYACAAASFFTGAGMVGVVGEDFPEAYTALYRQLGIDAAGLQTRPGKTFRWSGVYEQNMNVRRTLSTDLNVFESFSPELPPAYRSAPFVLLGNIAPDLQAHVLDQTAPDAFVVTDTMNLWIAQTRDALLRVIARSTVLMLNDEEAAMLTGESSVRRSAARLLELGPAHVAIKRGEYGAVLASRDGLFLAPAYPVEAVADPTGAGDSFAGAFMGALAAEPAPDAAALRRALLYGAAVASFGVEAFSLDAFVKLSRADIEARCRELLAMIRVEAS